MATFQVIDTGSGQDTFYEGMVKDAANWAILEALIPVGTTATQTLTNKTLTSPTINSPTIATPTINIGSDANGDVYYRSSGTLARLAKGTAYQVLRMNSGATAPEWGNGLRVTVITATRAMDAATGDVAYTGAGFTPAAVMVFGETGGVITSKSSWGFASGVSAEYCIPGGTSSSANLVVLYENVGKDQTGNLKSLDADGCTIAWTRTGATASGSAELVMVFFA